MPIVPTIQVHRLAAGEYHAQVLDAGQMLFEVEPCSSMARALLAAASDIGPDLGVFAEVRVRGVSLGTFAVADLEARAEEIIATNLAFVVEVLQSCGG